MILSTHGSVSQQLLKTTEMIVGVQKNITWIDLLPGENTETLINKYSKYLSTLNVDTSVLFLIDIWGGSPFNAANRIVLNKENYDIITGINIPMLIELCISREDVHSCKELVQIALKCGQESIKSVKYPLSQNKNKNNIINNNITNNKKKLVKNNAVTNTAHTTANDHAKKTDHMIICLMRIDDRLIHGQVVTRWVKEYKIQRIIIVNDEISQDITRTMLIKQATPPGITAHIISIDKTIRVYNNPKYAKEKVIMLFTNPSDIVQLVEKGMPITSINIGGMAFQQNKKQINNVISVDKKDIIAFKKLDQYGIELEIRKVPSDKPLKIMRLIKEINK